MTAETRNGRPRARTEIRRRVMRRVYPSAPDRPRFLESRLLRAGEVAALLQVSRRSIAVWAQRGLIPFIETPGGHRRFRAADVRALVASLKRATELDDLPRIPERPSSLP
ncbi:MAG: helix-turn-helix domain-containing protein [Actinomycetota bacterium]